MKIQQKSLVFQKDKKLVGFSHFSQMDDIWLRRL